MRSDEKVTGLDACAIECIHPEKVELVRNASLPGPELAKAASMFKLLGDPTRAKLLYALVEAGELCVCDLAAATDTQESTVSQSLRMLRASGVVTGRRQGRLVYYRLADAHVRMMLDLTREHIAHDASAPRDGLARSRGATR